MALFNLTELFARLPPGSRVIGLDYGRKRIGIALSDVERRLASPAGFLPRGRLRDAAGAIRGLARREGAAGIVAGLPLEMDGRFGSAAQAAQDWVRALSEATGLPAAMRDERLSTAAVERVLIGGGDLSRGRRARVVDGMAAAWVLQGVLDEWG